MSLAGRASASTGVRYGTTSEDLVAWLQEFPKEALVSITGTPGDRNEGMQYSISLSWPAPTLNSSGARL